MFPIKVVVESANADFIVARDFQVKMSFTAADIARHLEGTVLGDGSIPLRGFAAADQSQAGDLTFAENEDYFTRAEQSPADAILIDGDFTSTRKVLIKVANARIAFAKVLPLFFPPRSFAPGVHPTAVVADSARIDPTAHVGPLCVLGERTLIGPRAVLEGSDHVGEDCHLGEDVHLFPRVTLYPRTQVGRQVSIHSGTVIGSDGFGYVLDAGQHRKVPQVGHVILHDGVEIGANVAIDRGALGPTVIGRGTKIDNLVQIAHNVVIGEHCIIVGQVGIAGSTRLGNHVVLAGQVGLAGHIKIGNQVTIAAQSGVMDDIPDGQKWFGYPARPDRQMKRQLIALQQLPELIRRVQDLERRLARKGDVAKGG
jgi:UDP-3-O-[3-hydroxymyristoyl] glucosamine N-acyltransferase